MSTMGTVYVLGAGFSKTCGIATDKEMLSALNPLLKKSNGERGSETYIDAFLEQNFPHQSEVGFELFMSTISALKYSPEYLGLTDNKFQEAEKEIRRALKQYLNEATKIINWRCEGKAILDFVRRVNWQQDALITFNYDQVLEAAVKQCGFGVMNNIFHLHGNISDKAIAWPTYRKFAYRNTRSRLAERWKNAYNLLSTAKRRTKLERIIFIGYSMPTFDLEARGLFNYTDWYNHGFWESAQANRLISETPKEHLYGYEIIVIDPSEEVRQNYKFLRKEPEFFRHSFADWLVSTKTA